MSNYNLTQTGQEVQNILNQAPETQQDLSAEIERSTNKDTQLEGAISAEKTRAEGAEGLLQTAIGNEVTRAEGAEGTLSTAIANEKTRAEGIEGGLRTDVDAIEDKIPATATAENKMATEGFVNSSIATNTAEFKGTFNSLEELQTEVTDANTNDYAFVVSTDASGNTVYSRYKYTNNAWAFEYALNNSNFTAAQWAAIQSGITAALVTKLTGLPTAASLTQQLNDIIGSVTAEQTRAEGIEGGLRTDVNTNAAAVVTERTRAQGVEGTLTNGLNAEILNRQNADTTLQGNINAEALLRGNADNDLQDQIDDINDVIPSSVSPSNKLVDESFVNSSIATNTATFRGTYNSLAELQAVANVDANDYGFVISTDAAGNTKYNRYKYVEGSGWTFEYSLNNSSFTAAQWAAIQSGITTALVAKLNGLPDSEGLDDMFAAITDMIPSTASSLNKLADKAYVELLIESAKNYADNRILAAIPAFKGIFTSLEGLNAVADKKAGDLAIVRTTDYNGNAVLTFYQYNMIWNSYYTLSRYDVNKPATTGNTGAYPYNGMGCIELPKNMVDVFPSDSWGMVVRNNIEYLIYSYQMQYYAVYNIPGNKGLTIENNVVVENDNYQIEDIEDIVGERYLSYTENGGIYTISKPDTTTIAADTISISELWSYDNDGSSINVLLQSMFTTLTNTRYIIRYDYDLMDMSITIPNYCVLEFEGGSISAGDLTLGDNCKVVNGNFKEFGKMIVGSYCSIENCTFDGLVSTVAVVYGSDVSDFTIKGSKIVVNDNNSNNGVSGVQIDGGTNVNVLNCVFEGSKAVDPVYWSCPLIVNEVEKVRIVGCTLTKSAKEGLVAKSCTEVLFDGNTCTGTGYSGIVCDESEYVIVTNNHVYNTGSSPISTNCKKSIICNNTVHGNTSGNGITTGHQNYSASNTRVCNVSDNLIYDIKGNGILTCQGEEVIISGNIIKNIYNLQDDGIFIEGYNEDGVSRTKKTIISNNNITFTKRGIYVPAGKYPYGNITVSILGNYIGDTDNKAIEVIAQNIDIKGNTLENILYGGYSILCQGGHTSIDGNSFKTSCRGIGIFGLYRYIFIKNNTGILRTSFIELKAVDGYMSQGGNIIIQGNDVELTNASVPVINVDSGFFNTGKTNSLKVMDNVFFNNTMYKSDEAVVIPHDVYPYIFFNFVRNISNVSLLAYQYISNSSWRPKLDSIEKGYKVLEVDTGNIMEFNGNTWTQMP